MNVSVFGLGYVGCVSAACLAAQGHHVMGVDMNIDKVEIINKGHSPIIEQGLEELIKSGRSSGKLQATNDPLEAVNHSEIMLICVGTPSDEYGNLNFKYIDRVCTEIAHALRGSATHKVIAIRSTVLPGTITKRVVPLLERESGKRLGEDFSAASNPEFLRESSAIDDFYNPPFTLIGQVDEKAGDQLEKLYNSIKAPVYRTDPDTACLVKYASNAYHGLKIAFSNEIGQISKKAGVDGTKVMEIFCQDASLNISKRYLRPGFAFGGSCLPKDLRALLYLSRHNDLRLPVMESILASNEQHIQNAVDIILRDGRKKVGILGLTFKQGTDDLRESPLVELVETLAGKGYELKIYDKNVDLSQLIGGNKAYIESVIPHISRLMRRSMEEVIGDSEIVILAHNIKEHYPELARRLNPEQLLIDLVKIDTDRLELSSKYEGICW